MTAFGGALSDPTKIMGGRIGAYVVDTLIAAAVIAAFFFTFEAHKLDSFRLPTAEAARMECESIRGAASFQFDDDPRVDHPACLAIGDKVWLATRSQADAIRRDVTLVAAGFSFLNWVLLPTLTGASLGKFLFGLRVVTSDGQTAGFGRQLGRWALLIVDAACCYLPGLLTSFNTKGHRRVGDLAASTFVVHRSAAGRPLAIPGLLVVHGRDPMAAWSGAPQGQAGYAAQPAGAPSAIDGPVFDPARNTYVRYDQVSGSWFQWDDRTASWVALST
ncbi:RDD family protein [Aquihabitans sp. McL0605]|uniref:RDD family protein n=1 Tax=Aquihabitans sp. McL0605 TaxID=3415671 RepID=UPI003CEE9032